MIERLIERKTLPFDVKVIGDKAGPGSFSGRASTFGSVDSMGDVVDRGAYKDTIPEFVTKGFIAWGHDWSEPIAHIKSAEERADGLYVTGEFHSTAAAQDVRTIARERAENGKFMGLSIGFEAEEWEERKVDEAVRNRWGEWSDKVRALTKIKLYEVSLVTVPAEPLAGLTTVKGFGIPIEEHARQLRVALDEFAARCTAGSALREHKVGRAISAGRALVISGVSGSLRSHADALDELVNKPAADEDEDAGEEEAADPVIGSEPEKQEEEAESKTGSALDAALIPDTDPLAGEKRAALERFKALANIKERNPAWQP